MTSLEALANRLLAEQRERGTYFHFEIALDEGLDIQVEPVDGEPRHYEVAMGPAYFILREVQDTSYLSVSADALVAMFFPAAVTSVH